MERKFLSRASLHISALLAFWVYVVAGRIVVKDGSELHRDGGRPPSYNPGLAMEALQYCKASYCPVEALSNWSCGDACSGAHQYFNLHAVHQNEKYSVLGYVGVHQEARRIVVAFRGTVSIVNWISNLNFFMMKYPATACGPKCEVHRGFYESYLSVRDSLVADVLFLQRQYPKFTVLVTGHSLGAALALLCAVDLSTFPPEKLPKHSSGPSLRDSLTPLELYTFGEPRVGNALMVAYVSRVLAYSKQFRVVHGRDPVPHLPPRSTGYVHLPQEMWLHLRSDSSGPDHDRAASDPPFERKDEDDTTIMTRCNDSIAREDPTCSNSAWAISVLDHLMYLGVCTKCTCTAEDMHEIESYRLHPDQIRAVSEDFILSAVERTRT